MTQALQVHTRRLKLDPDVTDDVLRQVARDLPGLSGPAIASHARFVYQALCHSRHTCPAMSLLSIAWNPC